jgi:hypothetical protein
MKKSGLLLLILGFCALGRESLRAQVEPDVTLTITFTGTLGPVLSGADPLGGNGGSGTLTVVASESLSPFKETTTSATYKLPAGAMRVVIGSTTYTTTGPSTMKFTLPAKGPDTIVLSASVTVLGTPVTVVGTAALAHGSLPATILHHPGPFSPSPQKLTPAASATGPGSKVKYTLFGGTTVLGLTGTASNSAAAEALIPDDEDTDQ